MNILLVLLTALHQNAVRKDAMCPYQPENNSTNPAPIFYRGHYIFNATGSGQILGQVGAYSPWNSKVWFSLVGTDDVTIDKTSGALRVVTNLRPDQPRPRSFYAVATDSQYKSATVAVTINVTSNEGPAPSPGPRFSRTYYATKVLSNLSVNAVVIQVSASGSMNDQILFSLFNTSQFRIDPDTGAVYLARPFGNARSHVFTVGAAYRSYPSLRAAALVRVNVTNNTFSSLGLSLQSSTAAQVYSDVTKGQYVTSIRATSRDPAMQSQVRYYLEGSSLLRIDQYSGAVYVAMLPMYDFTRANITARLGTVSVGTRLVVNKVCRPGLLMASCLPDPCQLIGAEEMRACPQLRNATCLANYCGGCKAEFYRNGSRVNCSALPNPPSNNAGPFFSSPQYRIRVWANQTVNSVVGQIYASGPVNTEVAYTVMNTTYFDVNRSTGALYLIRDISNLTDHSFPVRALFTSAPWNYSIAYVHVEIIRRIDVQLRFDKGWYATNVSRGVVRGTQLLTVFARVSDSAYQSQVRYAVQGHSGLGIDERTGAVYVTSLPLPERSIVNVVARLGDVSTTTIVDVRQVCPPNVSNVTCAANPCGATCLMEPNATCVPNYCSGCHAEYYMNGNRINCSGPTAQEMSPRVYRVEVVENSPAGTVVVDAYTLGVPFLPAVSANPEFRIESGGDGMFRISDQGVLSLQQSLDHEKRQRYDLVIAAVLSATGAIHVTRFGVTVRVLNINDNAPAFGALVTPFVVPAGQAVGAELFKFWAVDEDPADVVTYRLTGASGGGLVALDSATGVLSASTAIPPGVVSVTVQAADSGVPPRTATASVELRFVDASAGYPTFPYRFGEFRLLELSPRNSLVKTIPATGGQRIRYRKTPGSDPYGLFRVNQTTGSIYTDQLLDREGLDRLSCVMEAEDLDTKLVSYVQIFVEVMDVNDNAPVFPYDSYLALVSRNADPGQIVFTAFAMDVDLRSTLVYSITSGNSFDYFRIANNNNVVVNRSLMSASSSSFALVISVSDGLQAATTTLRIYLQD